jgi:hypothetical protein
MPMSCGLQLEAVLSVLNLAAELNSSHVFVFLVFFFFFFFEKSYGI